MLTKLAAQAAIYITVLYLSSCAVTSVNAQCIDNGISTNISSDLVVVGDSVTLSCYVSGAGTHTTSWVDPADELISVDAAISANSDPRFVITANNANPDCMVYNLTISNLTTADAGAYSCRPTTLMNPMSSEVVYFGYAPAPTYPECRMKGGSTLVRTGDVLEFICETDPGTPEWDLIWLSSQYGDIATPNTTSMTTNSELKSITTSINATHEEDGKILSCIASCSEPECIDNVERNCSLGQIVVVDNPVDEYFFIAEPLVHVTMGANASIECQTTLNGTELQWFLHETITENYVTETTPTGQSATLYITAITNITVANPFVCSLSIDGSVIATRKASLTFDPSPSTMMPSTTDMTPMNITATPSMLVNITSQAPVNATSQPGNATTTAASNNATFNETTTQSMGGNTTMGTTAGPMMNATTEATTGQQVNTTDIPMLQTNASATQSPNGTTLAATTMPSNSNTTSDNTTGTASPFNPTIVQRTETTLPWWKPQTTLFPQLSMFPHPAPTSVQAGQPSSSTSATTTTTRTTTRSTERTMTTVESGPTSSIADFFTLPVIMGIAAVGGLLLLFIVIAIVCVLTSKKRRGGEHDVEELTELSKRHSKPIRLDPFEVPANTTNESDPTFAAFGKGTSTQDLINIGDDPSGNAQQNGSNNVGKNNKNNGRADTKPLTANDMLSHGLDNHGMSDSIL